jgi:arylsulfatase A-like enzyme
MWVMRTNRRLRATIVAALVGVASLSTLSAPEGAAQPADALPPLPNVVIIVTDDQREGLEVMPKTQRLLGEKGVTFENAFATTPLCCPARASIMTGRYSHNTDVHTEADAAKLDQETTLQHYLQKAGYRTALFGKYLNSWRVKDEPPYFDEWAFFNRSKSSYLHGKWNVDGDVKRIHRYSTTYLRRKATRFVEERDETAPTQPWFMYLAPSAPHRPFIPQERYRKAKVGRWQRNPAILEADRSDKPNYVQIQDIPLTVGRKTRAGQFRTLMSIDDMVAAVVRKLRDAGELGETFIFYISDNGLMWGEHGLRRKAVPYMPSVHIPFLMRVPGTGVATVDQRLVGNIDIAPTVMEATGLQATAAPMDGRSLLDEFARERILMEYFDEKTPEGRSRFDAPSWASLQTRVYQYTEYYSPTDHATLQFRELYDLHADPYQLVNLLGDADSGNDPPPLEVQSLSVQLARDRLCSGIEGPRACP